MDIMGFLYNLVYAVVVGLVLGFFVAGIIGVIVLGIVKLKKRLSRN